MVEEGVAPGGGPGLWASLHAREPYRLIEFLVNGLGFVVGVVHGDGSVVYHAELRWPQGGGLMMGSSRESDQGGSFALSPGTFGCYLVTDDTDELFARSLNAGAIAIDAPFDTSFGSRQAVVRDFEGNQWSFGTYRGE